MFLMLLIVFAFIAYKYDMKIFLFNLTPDVLSIKTEQDLGDDIWKDVALGLGYTELEIDLKFKGEDEPIAKLLDDFKKRGGNANDFISAMYKVGRGRNLENFRNRSLSSGSENEIEDDLRGFAGNC